MLAPVCPPAGEAPVRSNPAPVPRHGADAEEGHRAGGNQETARLCAVEGELVAVGQAVVVGVEVDRVGDVHEHLVAVGETVAIGVRVERVGVMGEHLVAIGEAVSVGVGLQRVQPVNQHLVAIGEAVGIGVGAGPIELCLQLHLDVAPLWRERCEAPAVRHPVRSHGARAVLGRGEIEVWACEQGGCLAPVVLPPARHRTVGLQPAAEVASGGQTDVGTGAEIRRLSVAVVPPAFRCAVEAQPAGVVVGRSELGVGTRALQRRFPRVVVAPTRHITGGRQRTGVVVSGHDLEVRPGALARRLAARVPAPAFDGAVVSHAAGVGLSRSQVDVGTCPLGGGLSVVRQPQVEAGIVFFPAPHIPIHPQRAGVELSDRDVYERAVAMGLGVVHRVGPPAGEAPVRPNPTPVSRHVAHAQNGHRSGRNGQAGGLRAVDPQLLAV